MAVLMYERATAATTTTGNFRFFFFSFLGASSGASAGTFRVCTVHQVLQVFVLAPSRTLNVIRARCSGSLYFQILADKSGRQAGRQASQAVLPQLAILGCEQSALAIMAYFSNPSFRSVTSTAPEQ